MAGSPLGAVKIECVDYITAEESASAGCAPDDVNNTGSDPGIKTEVADCDSDDTTLTACSTEILDIDIDEEFEADAGVDEKPISDGPSKGIDDPLSGPPVVVKPAVLIGPTRLPNSTTDGSLGFGEKKKTPKAVKGQCPKVRKKKELVEKYCKLCEYRTFHNRLLNQHMLSHSDERPFACDLCGYRGRTKSRLIDHMMTHTNEKPFACDLCNFKSQRGSGLKRHVLTVHNGAKRFACDICDVRCSDAASLKDHMTTHTGQFQCEYCDFKSSRAAYVKRHMETNHSEEPLTLDVYDYKCGSVNNLEERMRTHGKPLACDTCDYKCSSDSDLRKHVMISHSSSANDDED